MKFLIVDDSAVMRKMIIKALTEVDFPGSSFTEATDGDDAVAQFQPQAFDVALVDWNMPKMLGIDCVRELRARDKKITILMVTTEVGITNVQQAKKQDVDGYVGKPFDSKTLTAKIKRAIEDSRWRR